MSRKLNLTQDEFSAMVDNKVMPRLPGHGNGENEDPYHFHRGHVYIVEFEEAAQDGRLMCKIGCSGDHIKKPRRFLKLWKDLKLHHKINSNKCEQVETYLHRRFKNYQQNNSEFFLLSPEDLDWLKSHEYMDLP